MTDDLKARLRAALVGTTQGPWTLCAHLRMENENGCTCGYRGVIFAGETEFAICQPGHDVTNGEEGLEPPRLPRSEEIANSRFIAAARDLIPESADRIEQLEAENFALASWQCVFTDGQTGIVCDENGNQFCQQALALTQSRAETAAAYERAADAVWHEEDAICIRALATPDQTAALDAVRAEARAQGMREAAIIAHDKSYMDAHDAILAAIKGAKA